MKRFVIVGLVMAVIGGFLGEGSTAQLFLLLGIGFYLLLPFLFLLGLVALWDLRRDVPRYWVSQSAMVTLILFGVLALSAGVGEVTYSFRKKQTQNFVRDAIPGLELIRSSEGEYPAELPDILRSRLPLWMTRVERPYGSDGSSYAFYAEDPAAFMFGGFAFYSNAGTWTHLD